MSGKDSPSSGAPRASFRGLGWALSLALLAACSTAPPPASTLSGTASEPEAPETDGLQFAGDWVEANGDSTLRTDETLLEKILRSHPPLQELEQLYVDGGAAYLDGQLDLSEEYFYLLAEGVESARSDQPDSLALLYLGSLDRKLGNFIEILSEERFFSESYAPVDQTLTDVWDSLRVAYGIPEFLRGEQVEPSSFEREILNVQHERVDAWIDYFTGRGRTTYQRWLDRQGQVGWILEEILAEEDLPVELQYLAMIESGLQAKVRSRASAVGYWQFVRSTARNRGLLVNEWVDERRDIEKSTRAACRHLQMLHGMFGNWPLALAAYNAGEYRIQRAIGLQGDPDYWHLRLPRETREYVPKFIAALRIGLDPEAYGFQRTPQEPLRYDVVEVDDTFSLDQIAKAADASTSTLENLNPNLIAQCTPPKVERYAVRVPEGRGEATLAALQAIPESERITWRKHRVKSGENLGQLARRYHTSVTAIMELNGITNARRVRAGRELTIPYPRGVTPTRVATSTPAPPPPAEPGTGRRAITYRVRSGDTLSAIAEAHDVSVTSIRRLNRIRGSRIHAGQALQIHVDETWRPAADPFAVSDSTHELTEYQVRSGDTLAAIGRRFRVDVAALLAWNRLEDRSIIRPGDRLQIWQPRQP